MPELNFDGSSTNLSTLSSVVKICESGGIRFKNETEIPNYVEAPLVDACTLLFRKNILTNWSSANADQPVAQVGIDFASLSDRNKQIALNLNPEYDPSSGEDYYLTIAVTGDTNVSQVHDYFINTASQFEFQNAVWETRYTLDQMIKWNAGSDINEISQRTGFYYNPEDGFFYRDENACQRYYGLNRP